jgi:hypothetical protein
MKMVAAPILAVMLAVFLAAAISNLPVTPKANETKYWQSPNNGNVLGLATPAPIPRAAPSVANFYSPFIFIAGAVIIAILAVVLLFREKT